MQGHVLRKSTVQIKGHLFPALWGETRAPLSGRVPQSQAPAFRQRGLESPVTAPLRGSWEKPTVGSMRCKVMAAGQSRGRGGRTVGFAESLGAGGDARPRAGGEVRAADEEIRSPFGFDVHNFGIFYY